MVKDPAIETIDKVIEGLESVASLAKEIMSVQDMQTQMIYDLEKAFSGLDERIKKLEEYRQLIDDNMEQPF